MTDAAMNEVDVTDDFDAASEGNPFEYTNVSDHPARLIVRGETWVDVPAGTTFEYPLPTTPR